MNPADKAPLAGAPGSVRVCPKCGIRSHADRCMVCRDEPLTEPVISKPCLRDHRDHNLQGPCSAGLCCWPDCVPPNAPASATPDKGGQHGS